MWFLFSTRTVPQIQNRIIYVSARNMICNRIYGRYGRLREISMQDKITINPFDPDSIDEAIKKLEKRKERIHKCAEKLIQRLTDLGVEKAQELVPVDTGTARSSIIGYLDEAEGVGIISAGGYCKYIEFGTGVKGRDNSHPSEEYKAIMNWAYNSGATIFTTKDGREGWYYPADDGTWRFTEGMPSRPFMYETAQYLRKEAQKIASEVFKDG